MIRIQICQLGASCSVRVTVLALSRRTESSLCQVILLEAVRGASMDPVGGGGLIGLGWLSGSGVTVPKSRVV